MKVFNRLPALLLPMISILLAGGCEPVRPRVESAPVQQQPAASTDDFELGAERPASGTTLYATARLLARQGRDQEAQMLLIRAIHASPDFLPPYCDLADLYLRHRHVEQAIVVLTAGLKVAPQNPLLLNNLGMCQVHAREYQSALKTFTHAAAIAPQNPRYRANMALCLGMLGRYEESLSLYQSIVSAEQAQHNLAVLVKARKKNPFIQANFTPTPVRLKNDTPPTTTEPPQSTAQPATTADSPMLSTELNGFAYLPPEIESLLSGNTELTSEIPKPAN